MKQRGKYRQYLKREECNVLKSLRGGIGFGFLFPFFLSFFGLKCMSLKRSHKFTSDQSGKSIYIKIHNKIQSNKWSLNFHFLEIHNCSWHLFGKKHLVSYSLCNYSTNQTIRVKLFITLWHLCQPFMRNFNFFFIKLKIFPYFVAWKY